MPYIAPEVITEAKRMDLLTYLKNYEPSNLVRYSGSTYCTKEHDSLKISNGKWMWWSRGIGGKSALDYLIKVKGMSFVEAVEAIMGSGAAIVPVYENNAEKHEDRPLLLPQKSPTADVVTGYLLGRGIDMEIINYCLRKEFIFESLPYHNVVFVGYDEDNKPKYASYRATNNSRIMGDCTGSKKEYSFRLENKSGDELHLFESAIDLLSYATLKKFGGKEWRDYNLVSLAGVYSPKKNMQESKLPATVRKLLEESKNIRRIVFHLDNDTAGRNATAAMTMLLKNDYEVVDEPPKQGKDFNDFLCARLGLKRQNERSFER